MRSETEQEPEVTAESAIVLGRGKLALSLATVFQIGTALVAFLTGVGVMKMDVSELRSDLARVQTTADQTASRMVQLDAQVNRSLDEIRLLRELLYQNGTLKYSPAIMRPAVLKVRINGNGG